MDRRAAALLLVAGLALCAVPACFGDSTIDMTASPKVDNGVSSGHATATDATSLHRYNLGSSQKRARTSLPPP
ncbi:hypothetical protein TSOC_009107 [Tetrabaena socialis]|uniref:Uncharacterized protein n=1 Tax=Tetrabaena socialis TaxID=47790 RepID=A0A2J7ZWP2_9CHLO|nr:hypothetical protein TSOC_009108 [Tetrabaena socialis]PNH04702.1 hypothetical protein TSOC_009107 [Tetrabaena socialis]|eukprot:PNH04697.1 hypothetical protein TSOC_009108 [Tetrabaena socialis]